MASVKDLVTSSGVAADCNLLKAISPLVRSSRKGMTLLQIRFGVLFCLQYVKE